jgi:hypothetical protein
MTHQQWTAVDRYITDLLVPGDPALDAALQASAAAGLPPHNVSSRAIRITSHGRSSSLVAAA